MEKTHLSFEGRAYVKRRPTAADILLWEQLKELQIQRYGAIKAVKEWGFCEDRKWRFDFAVLPVSPAVISRNKVGIEIEGGAFTQGRHTRGVGFVKDCEKYNHAAWMGWRVLRFTPQQVLTGEAIAFIRKVLES